MKGHILITGCAGFIGSHLTDRLLADGHRVVGVDSFEDYYARGIKEANLHDARANPAFSLHEANILDLAAETEQERPQTGDIGCSALSGLLRDCTCVYHLAAQAGVRASWGRSFEVYTRNNVLATQQLLEACVVANVPKVVYASSSSVYGDQDELPLREDMLPRPRSPYGVTKLAGEHLCLLYNANYSLHTVALRFFTVFGPRQRPDMAFHRFMRAILEGSEIVMYGDGTQTRDFTYVDDIIEGLVLAPAAPAGSVMNLGGAHRVGLLEAIAILGDVAGVSLRVQAVPAEVGDVRDTWADMSATRHLLGWRSRTGLSEGLRQEWDWLVAAQHRKAQ